MAQKEPVSFSADEELRSELDEVVGEDGNRSEVIRESVRAGLNDRRRRARDVLASLGGYSLFIAVVLFAYVGAPQLAAVVGAGASVMLGGAAWEVIHGD